MSAFSKRFFIEGRNYKVYYLTDKELYERVMEDSKSNFNWITSATELVRVCVKKGFSEEYAKDIKILILNCFSNINLCMCEEIRELENDHEAVYFCYNSLTGTDEKVVIAKQKYLNSFITNIVYNYFEFSIHTGPKYIKMCDEWISLKFEENIIKEKIDFKALYEKLKQEFGIMIEKAEKQGVFKEEDEERFEKMLRYAKITL